jgi:hypothetical protein
LQEMIKGKLEDAKIIVGDIRVTAGNINFWPGKQTLRRCDHGDQDIGEQNDRKIFGMPGLEQAFFGELHNSYLEVLF